MPESQTTVPSRYAFLLLCPTDGETIVDDALAAILTDESVTRDILCVLLELVAFFNKEERDFPPNVIEAARDCALRAFQGDLDEPVPALTLWVSTGGAEHS